MRAAEAVQKEAYTESTMPRWSLESAVDASCARCCVCRLGRGEFGVKEGKSVGGNVDEDEGSGGVQRRRMSGALRLCLCLCLRLRLLH